MELLGSRSVVRSAAEVTATVFWNGPVALRRTRVPACNGLEKTPVVIFIGPEAAAKNRFL